MKYKVRQWQFITHMTMEKKVMTEKKIFGEEKCTPEKILVTAMPDMDFGS